MPGQGMQNIPLRIPEKWDAAWYSQHIREVLALADTRNAIEGSGIVITGQPGEEATISTSEDLQNLLLQSFVLATPSGFLNFERVLTGESGVVDIVDGGANSTITVALEENGVPLSKLIELSNWGVLGNPLNGSGGVQNINPDGDKSVLHATASDIEFSTVDHTYVSDFDEAAQDAVGLILTDSPSIDLTFNDLLGVISADVDESWSPTWTGNHTFTPAGGTTAFNGDVTISGNIFVNGTPRNIWLGDLNIQSTTPQVIYTETDGALDQKWWDLCANAEVFCGRLWDDAQSTIYNWLEVERSGTGAAVTADLIRLRAPVMTTHWLSLGADANAGPNGSGVAIGVNGISGLTATMDFTRWQANNAGPNLVFGKSRGAAVGTQTIVQNGDILGQFIYSASTGSAFSTCAAMRVFIDGTPGVGDMPTRFQFLTSADGTSSILERFEIMPNGAINLIPLSADPSSGLSNGQMYYNSSTNKFRGYAAGAWVDLH
jgi:hypothetical protein